MRLYSYWRSTTSYRVRIALHIKGIAYDTIPVDLVAGAQKAEDYTDINPAKSVPTLVTEDGAVLTQSMAIIEWIDYIAPKPPLLPTDPLTRAYVKAAALSIATDIHPVNNLRVVERLKTMGHTHDETLTWMNSWMTQGFAVFQSLITPDSRFCFGDTPGFADLCLVPQLYNAHRWGCDLSNFNHLTDIETRCLFLPAFDAARPENQPDATSKKGHLLHV